MRPRILYLNVENLFDTGILRAMVLKPAILIAGSLGAEVGFTSLYRRSETNRASQDFAYPVLEARRSERGFSIENVFLHIAFSLKVIWFARNYDILHCRSYMATTIGLLCKLVLGKKVIFDVRGYLVDEAIESGRIGPYGLKARLLRRLERVLFRYSDEIISVSEAMERDILKKFSRGSAIIRNPSDISAGTFRIEKQPKQLCYNGSLKSWHLPELFFLVAKTLVDLDIVEHVKVISKDVDKARKLSEAAGCDPSCISFVSCDASQVVEQLAKSSLGWCVIEESYAKSVCWPVKFNEYLAAGVPVVVNTKIGDLAELTSAHQLGLVLTSSTEVMTICNEISEYLRRAETLQISPTVRELLGWGAQISKLEEIYIRLQS